MSINSKKIIAVLCIFALCLFATELMAQCPMCKIAAESNLKNGGTAGRGLNKGILYMLAAPYALVGVIAFVWWRNRRKTMPKPTEMFSDN